MQIVRGQQAPLEDDGVGSLTGRFDPQAGKGIFESVADIRAIENLPILQIAAPAQADASRADASQGAGDAGQLAAGMNAGKLNAGCCIRLVRNGRAFVDRVGRIGAGANCVRRCGDPGK